MAFQDSGVRFKLQNEREPRVLRTAKFPFQAQMHSELGLKVIHNFNLRYKRCGIKAFRSFG